VVRQFDSIVCVVRQFDSILCVVRQFDSIVCVVRQFDSIVDSALLLFQCIAPSSVSTIISYFNACNVLHCIFSAI
jgi:hypothetical protein